MQCQRGYVVMSSAASSWPSSSEASVDSTASMQSTQSTSSAQSVVGVEGGFQQFGLSSECIQQLAAGSCGVARALVAPY